MNLETRQGRRHQVGKLFIATGAILALAGSMWRHHVRFAPLMKIDSATMELVQVETPHGRSSKRFIAMMMITGGGAAVASPSANS